MLAQKGFVQAAVDGDYLAGGFAEALAHEEKERFRLIGRRDRRFRQGAIGVELGELGGESFARFVFGERYVVFGETRDDAIAREHRAALYHGRGSDTVYADERRQFHREFANEMVGGGFGNVVGD